MKTKLLKKVRKRFSINKIEKIDRYSSDFYNQLVDEGTLKLPFYEVVDDGWTSGWNNMVHQTEDEAYEYLVKLINREYKNKIIRRRKNTKITKIWYI